MFIRIRRICSSIIDYIFNSRILIIQLCKRGYNFNRIIKLATSIGQKNRKDFLEYKIKLNNAKTRKFSLFNLYDNSICFLKKCVNNAFYKTQDICKKEYLNKLKLNFVNMIGTNISSSLIHSRKPKSFAVKQGQYNKCKLDSCNICNFVEETDFLKIKIFLFPIKSNSSCSSKGIVYIIRCNLCNVFYIGESG